MKETLTKKELRKTASEKIVFLPSREEKTDAVTNAALDFVDKNEVSSVAVYLSAGNELSTEKLVSALFDRGIKVSVPVITGDDMIFSSIRPDSSFNLSKYGIKEPSVIVTEEYFDVMFMPLVAFDPENNRLGHGKGYYDRYLQKNTEKITKKIGLAFAEQMVDAIPVESTDIRPDLIIYS